MTRVSDLARWERNLSYGEVGFINIPNAPVPANTTRVVSLQGRITSAHLPASVTFAGIELEYDSPKGTVITQVQSVSNDGNHVFEVPMMDPEKMPSSAGGFPWKADGDFRTVVYIKNETAAARKFTIHLLYDGGQYSLGVSHIKPNQTAAIDFRALRDSQTPDSMGRVIPLDLVTGQIAWSVKGGENQVLSGRSEQISLSGGVASTYSCWNCCPDSVYQTGILPSWIQLAFGASEYLQGQQTDMSCNHTLLGPYVPSGILWHTDDPNIVTVDGGQLIGTGTGNTTVYATWDTCLYWLEQGYCSQVCDQTTQLAPVSVDPWVAINGPDSAADGATVSFTAVVHGSPGIEFLWQSEAPSGAGNNPHVNFTSPNGEMTNAHAHWFALPNQECPGTSLNSTYKIKVTAWTNYGETTAEKDFTVNIPSRAGVVDPNVARVSGAPKRCANNGVWYVCGMGNLGRLTPTKEIFVLPTSQFIEKVVAHEQEHEDHWAIGNLLGHLHDPSDFFERVQNLTGTSEDDLISKLVAELVIYTNQQDVLYSALHAESERQAYLISDPIPPKYAYQNCGRFP